MRPSATLWLLSLVLAGCATTPKARPVTTGRAPIATPSPGIAEPPPGIESVRASIPSDRPDEDLIATYTAVWQAQLAEKNGVAPADVERAIPVTYKSIKRSDSGTWLVVRYRFALDWATVDVEDEVVVRIDSRHPYATLFGQNVDRWLSASEAATAARTLAAPTRLARLPIGKRLKFASWNAAIAALPGTSRVKFDEHNVHIELAGFKDKTSNLYLIGTVPLPGRKEVCLRARLDLVTGDVLRDDVNCGMVF
jgi:hypothetical protein